MKTLFQIITSVPFLVFIVLSTILGVYFVWAKRNKSFDFALFAYRRWWVFGSDYRGKLKKLVNDTKQDNIDKETGLTGAEKSLFDDFVGIISGDKSYVITDELKENARKYLAITKQDSKKPISMLARIALFILILGESLGTGLVLAPWLGTEVTPSQAPIYASILALVFAIVLAGVTHYAGEVMAKRNIYKEGDGTIGEQIDDLNLADDQDRDAYYIDKEKHEVVKNPTSRRIRNRIKEPHERAPYLTAAVVAIVIGIMVFIFWQRYEAVNLLTTEKVVNIQKNGLAGTSNPFAQLNAPQLPPAVAQAQQQSRANLAHTVGGFYKQEGVAAAALLALVYLVTQFLSFLFAYRSAFAGEGGKAYEILNVGNLDEKTRKVDALFTELKKSRKEKNHKIGGEDRVKSFKQYLDVVKKQNPNNRKNIIRDIYNELQHHKDKEDWGLYWEWATKNYKLSIEEQNQILSDLEKAPLKPRHSSTETNKPVTNNVDVSSDLDYAKLAAEVLDLPEGSEERKNKLIELTNRGDIDSSKLKLAIKAERERRENNAASDVSEEFKDFL